MKKQDYYKWRLLTKSLLNILFFSMFLVSGICSLNAQLLENPSFENDTIGWDSPWGSATLDAVSSPVQDGSWAVLITGRTGLWQGVVQDITDDLLANGQGEYDYSAWVRTTDSNGDLARGYVRIEDDLGDSYVFTGEIPMNDTAWAHVAQTLNVTWAGTLTDAKFCMETRQSIADFFVDNCNLEYLGILENSSFENDTTGWDSPWGAATLDAVSSPVQDGYSAVLITGRTGLWQGAVQDITNDLLSTGQGEYDFYAWVRTTDSNGDLARGYIRIEDANGDGYIFTNEIPMNDSAWTLVAQTLNVTWTEPLTNALFCMETRQSIEDFYMDNCNLVYSGILENQSFEEDTVYWDSPWGAATLDAVSSPVQSGSGAVLVTGRTGLWQGAVQDITDDILINGHGEYDFSAWVRTSDTIGDIARGYIRIEDANGDGYVFTDEIPMNDTAWSEVRDTLTVTWDEPLIEVLFCMETRQSVEDFYMDNCNLVYNGILENGNFEEDTIYWDSPWGAATLDAVSSPVQSGSMAVLVTGRTGLWQGAVQDIMDDLLAIGQGGYKFTAWVRTTDPNGDRARGYIRIEDDNGEGYFFTEEVPISDTAWTEVMQTLDVTWTGTLIDAKFCMETRQSLEDFYMDNCSLYPNQLPLADAGSDQTVTDTDRNGSESVTLDGSASSDPDGYIESYSWNAADSVLAIGTNPTADLPVGAHIITLTVTDNEGGTATDTVTVTVNSLVTSVKDPVSADGSVKVYPNPADHSIFIELINYNGDQFMISLVNSTGTVIQQRKYTCPGIIEFPLDNNKITPGIYIIRVNNDKSSIDKTIIVE